MFKFDGKNKIYVIKIDDRNIMIKTHPKSYDIDSFKYSILISLHYYDIFFLTQKEYQKNSSTKK